MGYRWTREVQVTSFKLFDVVLLVVHTTFFAFFHVFDSFFSHRSVTRSYFRRADGVMLLYDITNERSFLSVREWIDAVDVSESLKDVYRK